MQEFLFIFIDSYCRKLRAEGGTGVWGEEMLWSGRHLPTIGQQTAATTLFAAPLEPGREDATDAAYRPVAKLPRKKVKSEVSKGGGSRHTLCQGDILQLTARVVPAGSAHLLYIVRYFTQC